MNRLRVNGLSASGPRSYDGLLDDSLVRGWISVYRSSNTRDRYLRWLNALCVKSGLSHRPLLDLGPHEARRVVMNVVQAYLKEDKLVSARLIQGVVKSFFEYHDRAIRYASKKIAYDVIPTKDQIYRMADVYRKEGKVRLRSRAIILCLFQSGVRVNCLLNWRVGMVRDQLYPEIKVPVRLKITNAVDTKLSGYGLPYYYTFL